MTMDEMISDLIQTRSSIWDEAKVLWDRRDQLTAAESADYEAKNARLTELDERIQELHDLNEQNKQAEEYRAKHAARYGTLHAADTPGGRNVPNFNHGAWTRASDDERNLVDFFQGRAGDSVSIPLADMYLERDENTFRPRAVSLQFETRDLTTTSASGTFSNAFRASLFEHLVHNSAILSAGVTMIPTDHGRPVILPKTTSDGTAAIVGEGTALPESDPVMASTTLDAWKVAQFVELTNEIIQDSEIPITPAVLRLIGREVGNRAGYYYAIGTGTNQPTGLMAVAGTAVSGTVVSGVSVDELYDLFHSVNPAYREQPSAGWLMADSTWKYVSRLKDSQNRPLVGTISDGARQTLLGKPVFVDPNIAGLGSAAKFAAFGDMSAFAVRMTELRLERSTDWAFNRDVTAVRAVLRTDSDLVDLTGAVKIAVGTAA